LAPVFAFKTSLGFKPLQAATAAQGGHSKAAPVLFGLAFVSLGTTPVRSQTEGVPDISARVTVGSIAALLLSPLLAGLPTEQDLGLESIAVGASSNIVGTPGRSGQGVRERGM